jgi:nucleotidyltransferase/DNA polymerase involved in DNA repair
MGDTTLAGRTTVSALALAVPEAALPRTPRAKRQLIGAIRRAFNGLEVEEIHPGVFRVALRAAVALTSVDALLTAGRSRLEKVLGAQRADAIGLSTCAPLARAALMLPEGSRAVPPGVAQVAERLAGIRLAEIPGLEPRDTTRLNLLGVFTASDFAHAGERLLQQALGTSKGTWWFRALRGADVPPEPPSVATVSRVMDASRRTRDSALETLTGLLRRGTVRLMKNGMTARSMTLVAWSPTKRWTRSVSIEQLDTEQILSAARKAWEEMDIERPERVSVRFQGIRPTEQRTLMLFDEEPSLIEVSGSLEQPSEGAA